MITQVGVHNQAAFSPAIRQEATQSWVRLHTCTVSTAGNWCQENLPVTPQEGSSALFASRLSS